MRHAPGKALLWFLPPRLLNALSPQMRSYRALLHLSASLRLRAMGCLLLEQPPEVSLGTRAAGVVKSMQCILGHAVQGYCLAGLLLKATGGWR